MAQPNPAPYFTQAGLAAQAGVTRYAVWHAIERGLLKTVKTLDGTPLIHQLEAERWLSGRNMRVSRRRAPRPGKP